MFTIPTVLVRMAIGSILTKIMLPVVDNVLGNALSKHVPDWVWDVVETANPSAFVLGLSASVGYSAVDFGGGYEILGSTQTGKFAVYSYIGGSVGIGGSKWHGSFGAKFGMVFNCPDSSSYEGHFFSVTIPMKVLPKKVREAIYNKLFFTLGLSKQQAKLLQVGPYGYSIEKLNKLHDYLLSHNYLVDINNFDNLLSESVTFLSLIHI